jgi:hypothetical protein
MIDESTLAKPDYHKNLESTWLRSLRIFLKYTVERDTREALASVFVKRHRWKNFAGPKPRLTNEFHFAS